MVSGGLVADLDGRGLERGDVQWDPIPGGCAVRDVVVHLLHRADSVRKLYPFPFPPRSTVEPP